MSKLALLGGVPVVKGPLKPFNRIGDEERALVNQVIDNGLLSGFVGAWCDDFNGGKFVRQLEDEWSEFFATKHSVSVNSATSGLFAAIGAVGVEPGDEVIVPPYTMSATAMAPLVYGGIPVFVDIEPETFCLDPDLVRKAITPKTKAILAVNLFGHPAHLHELRKIADQHSLFLIEDNAQAPLAKEHERYAGTIGHIGVFSLNRHKHIQCGEGGICTTDEDDLALRLKLIRNHGENVIEPLGIENSAGLIGFNYRLTEPCAAIAIAQLRKAKAIIDERRAIAEFLTAGASGLQGITPPHVRSDCIHSYYVWSARVDETRLGISRATISRALTAEGFPNVTAYVRPLYLLPAFQQKIAFGTKGWPFSLSDRTYQTGMCPVTERMHTSEILEFPICSVDPTAEQMKQLVDAMQKVFDNVDEMRRFEQTACQ